MVLRGASVSQRSTRGKGGCSVYNRNTETIREHPIAFGFTAWYFGNRSTESSDGTQAMQAGSTAKYSAVQISFCTTLFIEFTQN